MKTLSKQQMKFINGGDGINIGMLTASREAETKAQNVSASTIKATRNVEPDNQSVVTALAQK